MVRWFHVVERSRGLGMPGRKERDRPELSVAGARRELPPEDSVPVRVDRVPDPSRLRAEVAGPCCPDKGRPGIDPEGAAGRATIR
jgi:hypothetical protein